MPFDATPKRIEIELDCDTRRLYGSLDEAIAYLTEIRAKYPGASLDEKWTGYEDMHMAFVYDRAERPDEIAARRSEYEAQEAKKRKDAQKKADLDADLKIINKLKTKHGLR